jgi:YHS domain-containing protein
MTRDHVCHREVDEKTAPAKTEYEGDTYYFHSEECKKRFESDPESFVSRKDCSQS